MGRKNTRDRSREISKLEVVVVFIVCTLQSINKFIVQLLYALFIFVSIL